MAMDACPLPPLAAMQEFIESKMAEYGDSAKKWAEQQEASFAQRRQQLVGQEERLANEKQELINERQSLQQEKNAIAKLVDDSEVLDLNVGGTVFAAKRSTLCMYDSMLSVMFSGRWNVEQSKRDIDGNVYLELNCDCFGVILEWLRARVIDPDARVPGPPAGKEDAFLSMVEYLQLEELSVLPVACATPHVIGWSCAGSALGCEASAIFEDSDLGWTSLDTRSPWIVVDLHKKCALSKLTLVFSTQFMGVLPSAVWLFHSNDVDDACSWVLLHQQSIASNFCEIPGLRCRAQFLKLQFDRTTDLGFIGLKRLQLA